MSPFEKGHKGYKGSGRPSGSGNKRKRNERPDPKNRDLTIDRYFGNKEWEKSTSKKTLDIDKMDYYIYNDLPFDEYYDSIKLYKPSDWKSDKGYNLNSQAKAKKDEDNGRNENV